MSDKIGQHEIPFYENNIKANLRTLQQVVEQQEWSDVMTYSDAIKEDAEEISKALEEEPEEKAEPTPLKPPARKGPSWAEKIAKLERDLEDERRCASTSAHGVLQALKSSEWEEAREFAETLDEELEALLEAAAELEKLKSSRKLTKLVELRGTDLKGYRLALWLDESIEGFKRYALAKEEPKDFDEIEWLTSDVTALVGTDGTIFLRFWAAKASHPAGETPKSFVLLMPEDGLRVLVRTGWFVRDHGHGSAKISMAEYGIIQAVNDGPFRQAATAEMTGFNGGEES